jgi:hypothetical protein
MKIEGVVISCYKHDVSLTRLCVASIRLWYPDLAIWLLKDRQQGDFCTREIERHWRTRVYPSNRRAQGWGFGKLEAMTDLPERRLLFIDSDIVFAGPVIDRLEAFHEDVVVDKAEWSDSEIETQFFSLDRLSELDKTFKFPGWGFNGGQIIATTGCLRREDLDPYFDWDARVVKRPDVFKMGDQGLTNYIVQRKVQDGLLSLRREPFMVWPGKPTNVEHVRVADLTRGRGRPELIHWAGLRWGRQITEMPRSDILLHFEDLYYSSVPRGGLIRVWRRCAASVEARMLGPMKIRLTWMRDRLRSRRPFAH